MLSFSWRSSFGNSIKNFEQLKINAYFCLVVGELIHLHVWTWKGNPVKIWSSTRYCKVRLPQRSKGETTMPLFLGEWEGTQRTKSGNLPRTVCMLYFRVWGRANILIVKIFFIECRQKYLERCSMSVIKDVHNTYVYTSLIEVFMGGIGMNVSL